jgi:predicted RNase H-like nuclease (RuvC/YqgF family)
MDLEPEKKILTKEELINLVTQWIEMDTEINKLNKTITEIKKQIQNKNKEKKKLTDNLLVIIKNNNSDITLGNHTLVHKVSKTTKPISKKYLLQQLNLYFKNQPDVASDVSSQILNNREVVMNETIILK